MARHQSIQEVTTKTVVKVSMMEILAVWRCAASLANREGMTGTAERLNNDADRFEELGSGTVIEIV